MPDRDPELEHLLYAEHLAFLRTELLRGHPPGDQVSAIAKLVKAREAIRKYRADLDADLR